MMARRQRLQKKATADNEKKLASNLGDYDDEGLACIEATLLKNRVY